MGSSRTFSPALTGGAFSSAQFCAVIQMQSGASQSADCGDRAQRKRASEWRPRRSAWPPERAA